MDGSSLQCDLCWYFEGSWSPSHWNSFDHQLPRLTCFSSLPILNSLIARIVLSNELTGSSNLRHATLNSLSKHSFHEESNPSLISYKVSFKATGDLASKDLRVALEKWVSSYLSLSIISSTEFALKQRPIVNRGRLVTLPLVFISMLERPRSKSTSCS